MAVPGWFPTHVHRAPRALRVAGTLLGLGLVASIGLPSAPAPASEAVRVPAPLVVEAVDPTVDVDDPALVADLVELHEDFEPTATASVPGLAAAVTNPSASVGGGITVTFDANHPSPSNVQAVVLAAVDDWNDALATNPSGPINVAVSWAPLESGVLGSAGPGALWAHPSLPSSSLYPSALANTLLGYDIDPGIPEVRVSLSSSANWYIGTTGSPGNKIDLYSVVLHELAHGLGFLGSASLSNSPPPSLDSYPFIYDRLVTYNGAPLLNYGNANSLLRSDNLHIDLSDSFQAKVYAPGIWREGSSFSHFDEASYPAGWPGALMTPILGSNQTERELDGPTLGVMARMGWPMDALAISPTITSATASSCSANVTWGFDLAQAGVAPDGLQVEAWRNGTTLDASVAVSAATTSMTLSQLASGSSYTLKLTSYARGRNGTPATLNITTNGAPGAPGMVTSSGSGLNRTISWSAACGAGITGYNVQRSTDGQNWTDLGTTGSLSLAVSLPAGVHQFRVRATNAYGPGPWGYSIPTGVAAGVVRPVALDGQIGRLYQAYFLRSPDPGGFSFWQSQRAAGVELSGVSNAFAASAEFQSAYGSLNDGAFVDLVYANVLGRAADPGGRAYWLSQLAAGMSRGAVMTGFSESAELIAATGTAAPTTVAEAEIYRLYVAFFLRFPDPAGAQYWVGVRQGGTTLESIAAAFVGSAEFVTTYGSLPDDRFVELVYGNVLARTPDGPGAAYWQGQLTSGVSRGSMMVGFSESPEFVIATGSLP